MQRDYDWARESGGSEKAVWRYLLDEEALDLADGAEGEAVATFLIDLVKTFERVQLIHVWRRGLEVGFPRWVLRLILQNYSMARCVVMAH